MSSVPRNTIKNVCTCKQIEKYSCNCEVPSKSLSELNENQIIELKKKVKQDHSVIIQSINTLINDYNKRLQSLCDEKCRIIIAGLDKRYEAHYEVAESLESEFNLEIKNYKIEISLQKITKRKIISFEKFLNKETKEKSKYKKILSKFYSSKTVIPPTLIPLQKKNESLSIYESVPLSSNRHSLEFSRVSENQTLARANTQKYDRHQMDLITKLGVHEKNYEKTKLFFIFAPNILFSYDTNTFQEARIPINSHTSLHDGMINVNIADSYVFMFYSNTKSHSLTMNKKCYMLNLQNMMLDSLPESYFFKQCSSCPLLCSDNLYFFGGLSEQGTKSAECEVYSIIDKNWKIITQLDTPAFYVSSVMMNENILLASNDFNCVKMFNPKSNFYQQFFNHDKITLPNSFVFLIKIGQSVYFFYQKGVYMINEPANPVYFGAFGALANLRDMVQYHVRGNTAYLLMSTQRIIKFTPVRGKNNCAEVMSIFRSQ
jgi:hypothetical protein